MLSIDYLGDRVNGKVGPEPCGRASHHECVYRMASERWIKAAVVKVEHAG